MSITINYILHEVHLFAGIYLEDMNRHKQTWTQNTACLICLCTICSFSTLILLVASFDL